MAVWFITGCSSGFGAQLALIALENGHKVIATSRNPSRTPDLVTQIESKGGKWIALDVTSPKAPEVLQNAVKIFGSIDMLVNNAAYAMIGPLENISIEECRRQMDTNYYGPLALIKAVLPFMREKKEGVIVNVSSAAGIHGNPVCSAYAASKFALEGMSESLSREIGYFGIRVVIVEPGFFRSNFSSVFSLPAEGWSEAYKIGPAQKTYDGMLETAKSMERMGDVRKGCQVIFETVTGTSRGKGKESFLRLILGKDSAMRVRDKANNLLETVEGTEELWSSTGHDDVGE